MNFIEVLTIIKNLLPLLIEIIKAVEEALPGKGNGEQKLATVREILEAGDEFTGTSTVGEIWPLLAKVIGSIVSMFNKTGTFGDK